MPPLRLREESEPGAFHGDQLERQPAWILSRTRMNVGPACGWAQMCEIAVVTESYMGSCFVANTTEAKLELILQFSQIVSAASQPQPGEMPVHTQARRSRHSPPLDLLSAHGRCPFDLLLQVKGAGGERPRGPEESGLDQRLAAGRRAGRGGLRPATALRLDSGAFGGGAPRA